jgi:surface polysaccharide O-acyltransferase-like enzyme
MHRPVLGGGSVFQSVVYFTPLYLFGILCSEKKEYIYEKLREKEIYLLLVVIAIAVLQVLVGRENNYRKSPFMYDGCDLVFIQKMVFAIFFMVWLHRFEERKIKILGVIAAGSFGIYFIHVILLMGIKKIKGHYGFAFPEDVFMIYCAAILVILALSMLIVFIIKSVFPKHSRYIIGS